jgi:hypothetical protein
MAIGNGQSAMDNWQRAISHGQLETDKTGGRCACKNVCDAFVRLGPTYSVWIGEASPTPTILLGLEMEQRSPRSGRRVASRYNSAIIATVAVIVAAIVTGICTMLSTESGQRFLLPSSASSQNPPR